MRFSFRKRGSSIKGWIVLWAIWMGLPGAVLAETLTIGGTGSATPLIERFAQAYAKRKPEVAVRIIDPPMGSSGSIRAVLAGVNDLAVAGRPVNEDEKTKGGQSWALGRTPFVMATSRQQPHPGFDLEQLAAIYEGKQTTWPDGSPIRLVLREPTESDTLVLRKMSPALDRAVGAALARPGMLVAANDLENLKLLEKTPGSLGSTNLGLLQTRTGGLQALALGGTKPDLDALAAGNYPYDKTLYLVRGPQLAPAAQAFVDFMLSDASKGLLEQSGYRLAPARP